MDELLIEGYLKRGYNRRDKACLVYALKEYFHSSMGMSDYFKSLPALPSRGIKKNPLLNGGARGRNPN